MFYFINKKFIFQLVVVLALLAWSFTTIATQLTICPMDGQTFISQFIFTFFEEHLILAKIVLSLMLLIECVFIQRFFDDSKLSENQTYMPVVFFLLFVNVGHFLSSFTPICSTLLLLSYVLLFDTKDENDRASYNRVFSSGILIGVATLLDPSAVWLLLFLTLVLLTNQFSKAKELIILLFGFLIVAIYLFSIMYLKDMLPVLFKSLKYLYTFVPLKSFAQVPIVKWIAVGAVLLISIYMAFVDKSFYDNKLIVLRKRFRVTHLLMFAMILEMLFSGLPLQYALVYLSLPITIYTSVLCLNKHRIVFHDFLIVALLVLLWL